MKANINAVFNIDINLPDPEVQDDSSTEAQSDYSSAALVEELHHTALDAVVKTLVAGLVAEKKTFSAYVITKILRDRTLYLPNGLFSFETVSVTNHRGVEVSVDRIDHDKVKAIVIDMYDRGQMQGFTTKFNGEYIKYTPLSGS